VRGDGYAFGICKHMFDAEGFELLKGDNDTGENYLAALPLLNQKGRVRLPNVESCRKQFASLQRHVQSGHETITHPRAKSSHDDISAAVAGCLVTMASTKAPMRVTAQTIAEYNGASRIGYGLGNIHNPVQLGPQGQFGERLQGQMQRYGGYGPGRYDGASGYRTRFR
jgi:hypothetical protein